MENQNVVTIYGQNLYPDMPLNSKQREHGSLRSWSSNYACRTCVFEHDSRSILPSSVEVFEKAWKNYVFENPNNYVVLPYPENFSNIQESLQCLDFRFRYRNPREDDGRHRTFMPGEASFLNTTRICSYEARYCLILAATNMILYLKNMVMRNTRFFEKIDFVLPRDLSTLSLFEMSSPLMNLPSGQRQYLRKVLFIKTSVYRELDDLIYQNAPEEFWSKLIYLVDYVALDMLTTVARRRRINRPNPNSAYQEVLNMIGRENMDLKQQIIHLLGEKEINEEVISMIYNLILKAGMQSPCF